MIRKASRLRLCYRALLGNRGLMQVKIFTGRGIDILEKEINEWLKQNSAIEIRHVTHTSDNRVMMQDVVTNWVIVWYTTGSAVKRA